MSEKWGHLVLAFLNHKKKKTIQKKGDVIEQKKART